MLLIKQTDELTPQQLITILKARVAVFVVEQNCSYQEVDDDDFDDLHVALFNDNGDLQAYTRVMNRDTEVNFGRVLVVDQFRKDGLGRKIVQETLDVIAQRFPNKPIKIQAQAYLQEFYESFGFEPKSDVYLEDDIPHLDMVLMPKQN
ncbi:GCN5 family acetyltransferase [Secundilactobacillus paracollinoides]|uniref:GCN5 family acetyltransferase n=1 Tax=Secundilactobacillus paracollinoides TaxID=240427 RepID=A0A1B2IXF5_9LACO|nr:GNAT family N-acetyltransferase [Secundilactobacillus paracollinoides]ANZ60888.1 GCN5 family acetyltransferase [Secundilactobacillus paracollinoides]ANZ64751.1 GCN5 family acetyltransferase [Secundilactobacillus paracollinoides]ANZ66745.1 GCN5 family acetyltransferase [Secundilactobacillus paracollinoides]